jgi:1-acyl-sn-glycerol-3-phosphate acyltransferase
VFPGEAKMIHYLFWLLSWLLSRLLVSFTIKGPPVDSSANLIVCNHVSSIDWLFIKSLYKEPVYFVADSKLWNIPIFNKVLDLAECIPISSNISTLRPALKKIDSLLKQGKKIMIFPEGKLTTSGRIEDFKPGIKKILQQHPETKIQVLYLDSLYDTWWSKRHGVFFYYRLPRLKRPNVSLHVRNTFHSILFAKVFKDYGLSYLHNYLKHVEKQIVNK